MWFAEIWGAQPTFRQLNVARKAYCCERWGAGLGRAKEHLGHGEIGNEGVACAHGQWLGFVAIGPTYHPSQPWTTPYGTQSAGKILVSRGVLALRVRNHTSFVPRCK